MISYRDGFFLTKMIKKCSIYNRNPLENEIALDYANSYALAAVILNMLLKKISTLKISDDAKTIVSSFIIIALVAIVSARLRAEALNSANHMLRLTNNTSRSEKNVTIAREFLIGLGIQIPYIVINIAMLKLNDKLIYDALYPVFLILFGSILFLNFLKALFHRLLMPENYGIPIVNDFVDQPSHAQNTETLKFRRLEILHLISMTTGTLLAANYEDNSPLYFIALGLLTAVFLQKNLSAAYVVYNEICKDTWEDIFEIEPADDIENQPGSAMAIILAREQSGMTERTSSIRDSTIALLDDNDDHERIY